MMKPFHAGRACESGVVAAEFTQLGFTATPIILEAGRGFFKAAGGGYDANAVVGKLGDPWSFAFPGVSIKPHPSGSLTHPGMGLMLDLIRAHDIKPADVKKVSVGVNRQNVNALIHNRPTTDRSSVHGSAEFENAAYRITSHIGYMFDRSNNV